MRVSPAFGVLEGLKTNNNMYSNSPVSQPKLKEMKLITIMRATLRIALIFFVLMYSKEAISQTLSFDPAPVGGVITMCEGGVLTVTVNGTVSGEVYTLNANPPVGSETLTATGTSLTFTPVTYSSISNYSAFVFRSSPSIWTSLNQAITVIADPTAPTLTLSQPEGSVNAGIMISATSGTAGSGGVTGCVDSYEYSIDGGTSWLAYTLGTDISTNSYRMPSVKIKALRSHPDGLGCLAETIYTWAVNSRVHDNTGATGSYYDIQQAIDATNTASGDVLDVDAGTYNERVTLTKQLTLAGAGSALTILDGTGLAGNGNGITLNTGITNVTIKDLGVKNYAGVNPNSNAGIYAVGGNTNLTITDVDLADNIGGSGFYANGPIDNVFLNNVDAHGHTSVNGAARGIVIWNGHKSNITITNCEVYNNNCCGIELQDGSASGVNISNNNVHDNWDSGIGLTGLDGTTASNLVGVNTLTNNGRFGIEIKNPNGDGTNTVISNNNVTQSTSFASLRPSEVRDIAGIAVFRRGLTGSNVDVPNGVKVVNNNVTGYIQDNGGSSSEGFGIVIEGTNHTATGNTLTGNDVGLQQQSGHTPYPGDGNQNDVADNYFGRGNSPLTCSNIVTPNTYVSNGTSTRNVNVGGGLVTNTTSLKTFCSIQAAIDDPLTVNGHTLTVAAGTYNEQVIVNKSLTIQGASGGNSILAGSGTGSGLTIAANNVLIKDFKIQNYTEGIRFNTTQSDIAIQNVVAANNISYGINFNAFTVSNVTITGSEMSGSSVGLKLGTGSSVDGFTMTSSTLKDNNQGIGVFATSAGTSFFKNVSISNCTFENNAQKGIYVEKLSNATLDNLTINNCGIDPTYASNSGIDLNLKYDDFVNITVKNSTITNSGATGTSTYPGGRMAISMSVRDDGSYSSNPATLNGFSFTGNTISVPNHMIAFESIAGPSNAVLSNNNFSALVSGKYAVINTGASDINLTCNWHGTTDYAMIQATLASPGSGDILLNTYSTDNTFASCIGPVKNVSLGTYYGTIQAAIDAVETLDGHVISAIAGTYAENILVNKSLEIYGAGVGLTNIVPALVGATPPGCMGSDCAGASNVIKLAANNIHLHDFTINGNNALLTSGIVVGGEDIDARNGIIGDGTSGRSNIELNNIEVKNMYLRGIYPQYTSNMNVHHNTVTNVRGSSPGSIAIFSWVSSGTVSNNTVSDANDAISANHSMGITFSNNSVTNSDSGIHSDNNGDGGPSTADLITNNTVTNGSGAGSYGIWVFVPYLNTVVSNNTITNVHVGLTTTGALGASPTVTITGNTVDGMGLAGSTGVYTTTSTFGFGDGVNNTIFTNNFVKNTTENSFFLEANSGFTNNFTANNNSITANSVGLAKSGGGTFAEDLTCNWWGSAAAVDVIAAVGAGNNYTPWLTNGTDDDLGTMGFQPVAGSCAGSPIVIVSAVPSPATCAALGQIVVTWSGGVTPYDIAWTGGSATGVTSPYTIPSLAAGSYTITVTDANGSTATVGPVIIQYLPVTNTTGPTYYATIQAAINAATAGDVINVCAGTYKENLFINKGISVIGAGRDVTIVTAAVGSAPTLKIKGNDAPAMTGNVLIDGLSFTDNDTKFHQSIVTTDHIPATSTLTFQNNRITNGDAYGFWGYHDHGTLMFANNIISDVSYGMLLEGWDTAPVTVDNNEFTNLHLFRNNGVPNASAPVGLLAMTYSGSGGVDCTNPYVISNNKLYGYAVNGSGILFYGGLAGAVKQYTNVEIASNEIAVGNIGIMLRNYSNTGNDPLGGVVNASIHNNRVDGNDKGLYVSGFNPGTTAHQNSIAGSVTYSIQNTGAGTGADVDATCNWYGTTDPLLINSKIFGDVTFIPFGTDGTDNNVAPGFQPVPASCNGAGPVRLYTDNTLITLIDSYFTIQEAVDAASNGNTIVADAGTYTENVTIDKVLDIRGANYNVNPNDASWNPNASRVAESIIIGTVSWTGLSYSLNGFTLKANVLNSKIISLLGGASGTISIANNIVSGESLATNALWVSTSMTLNVTNNTFKNFTTGSSFVLMLDGEPVGTYSGNLFENNTRWGMIVQGSVATPQDIIENKFDQTATAIILGNGGHNISRNIFTNTGGGIYAEGSGGNTISNNFFTNSSTAFYNAGSGGDFVNNNSLLGGNGSGFSIVSTSGAVIDATCNWYGTVVPAAVAAKISGPVSYSPFLTDGTDAQAGTIGFQPVPGSCSGFATDLYVNDNSQTGDVYTTAIGNNANPGTPAAPFATMAHAVSVANAGNTIYVDAGTYSESVVVNKTLTILGSNAIISPNTGSRVAESILVNVANGRTFSIYSGNTDVIINGFKFDGGSPIHDGNDTNNPMTSDVTFSKNWVINGNAIYAGTNTSWADLLITDNKFQDINATSTASSMQVSYTSTTTITDNTFTNVNYAAMVIDATPVVNISGNTIDGTGAQAIQLAGAIGAATVINNKINDANRTLQAADRGAIRLYGSGFTGAVSITNNEITGGYNGITIKTGENITGKNITVNENSITALTSGKAIYHGGTGVLSATCNWYGTAVPAAVAAQISGPVSYSPFLTNGSDNSPSIGFQPVPGSCDGFATDLYVNDNVQTGDVYTTALGNDANPGTPAAPFATVAHAISVANAGNTIYVDAGTYNENININKANITLKGANFGTNCSGRGPAGESVINSLSGPGSSVIIIGADGVTVDGFTISGASATYGVSASGMNGVSVRHNIITDIGAAGAQSTSTFGIGVAITTADISGINLSDNCLSDIRGGSGVGNTGGAVGIGVGFTNADFDVSGVTIDGNIISNISASTAAYGSGGRGAYGVLINVGASGSHVGKAISPVVTNNEISILTGLWAHGVGLEGETPSAMVLNNKIDGLTGTGGSNGVKIEDNAGAATVQIHDNSFTNLGFGIQNVMAAVVNATCNWYGTAVPATVATKVSGPVSYSPFLTNGSDNSASIGFQPVPGSCDGFATDFYVNDNVQTGDVYTTAIGNNANPGTPAAPFATVAHAISVANAGNTIWVDAGTYVENIIVNKELTINGPYAAVNACSGTRVAEAIIVPATNAIATGEMIQVMASNVTISGFTLDGDNPALTSGFLGTNGADINAAEGVTIYTDNRNNLTVTNNIFKNLSYFGVTLYGASFSAPATSGHVISNNNFTDLGTYDAGSGIANWGGGVLLYNNQYAAVTDNCMTNVRLGVQTGNFSRANPGTTASQMITGNTIETRKIGIFHNLFYSLASPITVGNNTITGLAHASETTNWTGMLLASLSQVVHTASNNNIDASAIAITKTGISVWNDQMAPMISGGTITGVGIGINVNNFEGYPTAGSDAGNTAATITGTTITGATIAGVKVHDNPVNSNGATVTATVGNTNTITGSPVGVWVVGSDATASVMGNNFTGNQVDIQVAANTGVVVASPNNNLSGSAFGIENLSANVVNGTLNYWGSASGPGPVGSGSGVKVTTLVDFCPWLNAPGDTAVYAVPGTISVAETGGPVDNDGSICAAETVTLTVTGATVGTTYLWSTGATTAAISVNPSTTTTYTVTVSYGGCATILNNTINVYDVPVVQLLSLQNVLCNGGNTGAIEVVGTVGPSPYNYLWNTMDATPLISNLYMGTYSVTMVDGNQCADTASYTITEPTLLKIDNFAITNETCQTCDDGTITVNASGGTPAYMYSKNGGTTFQTSNYFDNLIAGTYSMVVKDANGCLTVPQQVVITEDGVYPDLTPSSIISSAQLNIGNTANQVVFVRNIGSGPTTAPIVFRVTNYTPSSGLNVTENLSYDVNILGDTYILNNDQFDMVDEGGFLRFTSKAPVVIPAGGALRVGLIVNRTGGGPGTLSSTVNITQFTGGEINKLNNIVTFYITKL